MATNFRPPVVSAYSGELVYPWRFSVERGWPFRYLSYKSIARTTRDTVFDTYGWPIAVPRPLVTDWWKLAADLFVVTAGFAVVCWVIRWLVCCCFAIKSLVKLNWREVAERLIPAAVICAVAMLIMAVSMFLFFWLSINAWDTILTDRDITRPLAKRALWPMLSLVLGLVLLATARRWMECDHRKVKLTLAAVVLGLFVVLIDGIGVSMILKSYYWLDGTYF
jgi:hypothetical protein